MQWSKDQDIPDNPQQCQKLHRHSNHQHISHNGLPVCCVGSRYMLLYLSHSDWHVHYSCSDCIGPMDRMDQAHASIQVHITGDKQYFLYFCFLAERVIISKCQSWLTHGLDRVISLCFRTKICMTEKQKLKRDSQ